MLRRAIAAILVVLVSVAFEWSGALRPIEDWLTATRMEIHTRAPTGDVVIVDIDAKSIAAMGSWPWPRRVYAQLIDKLVALGAAEVALDVDFSAPSNPVDDAALEAALKHAGGSVILAAFAQRLTGAADAAPVYNRPLERFSANSWVASVNVRPDPDGQVRSFGYGLIVDGGVVPSMPAVLAGGLGEAGQEFAIDFSIDTGAIERISLVDVLHDGIPRSRIAGKKVIVGAQAVELRDFFAVPVAGTISGALLQAAATETLLQGRVLHETGSLITLAGLVLIAIAAFAIGRVRWSLMLAGLFSAAVGVEALAVVIQDRFALAVNTVPWHLALATTAIIVLVSEIDFRQLLQTMWRVRASNAEALLSKVVADNFAGVVVVDENGKIRAASQSASELLGFQRGLTGSKAREVLPRELLAGVEAALAVAGFERGIRRPNTVSLRRGDGEMRAIEYITTVSQIENEPADSGSKTTHRVASLTFTDVTEQKAAEAKIAYLARFDSLTELPNRNQIIERLEEVFTSRETSLRASAIVCFDLDGMKNINDTLGHHIGDLVLRHVAAMAANLLPHDAMVARFGGDEYVALFSGERAGDDALAFATNMVAAARKPFELDGRQVKIGVSAGVALADSRDKGPDDILKRADVALYRVKANGGNGLVVFERTLLRELVERQRFEDDLAQALDRGEFEVWYQPQIELRTNRLTGVEALLRWRHPERGMVSPEAFIPVAETIGFIDKLGEWALETACREVVGWRGSIRLAVNVSSVQFARRDMAEIVSRVLASTAIPPSRLDLEITESLFMQPSKIVEDTLGRLRSLGVGIALDDFGTGYSSLSYIQKFPITKIKLDQSFVADLPENAGSAAIVRAVASLAKDLGLHLNAEGVETAAQVAFLSSLGVDEVQGYLFGRPQPASEIVHLLSQSPDIVRLRA